MPYQRLVPAAKIGKGTGGSVLGVSEQRPEGSEGVSAVGALENTWVRHRECRGPGMGPV